MLLDFIALMRAAQLQLMKHSDIFILSLKLFAVVRRKWIK